MLYIIPYKRANSCTYELATDPDKSLTLVDAPNFWYLHGALQIFTGFDKAEVFVDELDERYFTYVEDGHLYLKDGLYDVMIYGYASRSRAFFWTRREGENLLQRGLVIDPANKDDLKYAEEKYKEQPLIM